VGQARDATAHPAAAETTIPDTEGTDGADGADDTDGVA
jgi:hypothetical protein